MFYCAKRPLFGTVQRLRAIGDRQMQHTISTVGHKMGLDPHLACGIIESIRAEQLKPASIQITAEQVKFRRLQRSPV